jgi:hypothetical protein
MSRRAIATATEPHTALLALTIVSCFYAVVYALLVLLTPATGEPLYFSLIVLLCAIGVASLYILRANQELAIVVYAWLAGICLGAMMIHDALQGECFDHLLWVYIAGTAYLIIYTSVEHAFFYALGSSLLGALLGLCEARLSDGIFYALKPLVLWLLFAKLADMINYLLRERDDIAEVLETWDRVERPG